MRNQELTQINLEMVQLHHKSCLDLSANERQNGRTLAANAQEDLPTLDYPVGSVWKSQTGMGNIGCVSALKMVIGWR